MKWKEMKQEAEDGNERDRAPWERGGNEGIEEEKHLLHSRCWCGVQVEHGRYPQWIGHGTVLSSLTQDKVKQVKDRQPIGMWFTTYDMLFEKAENDESVRGETNFWSIQCKNYVRQYLPITSCLNLRLLWKECDIIRSVNTTTHAMSCKCSDTN